MTTKKKKNTLKVTAVNNGYKSSIIDTLINKQIRKKANNNNNNTSINNIVNNNEIKYTSAIFENHVSNTLYHAFKKHQITVSFNTNNKIGKILTTKLQNEETSGIYKMTCECGSIYIGQTARNFCKRHKEYLPPKNIKKNTIIQTPIKF